MQPARQMPHRPEVVHGCWAMAEECLAAGNVTTSIAVLHGLLLSPYLAAQPEWELRTRIRLADILLQYTDNAHEAHILLSQGSRLLCDTALSSELRLLGLQLLADIYDQQGDERSLRQCLENSIQIAESAGEHQWASALQLRLFQLMAKSATPMPSDIQQRCHVAMSSPSMQLAEHISLVIVHLRKGNMIGALGSLHECQCIAASSPIFSSWVALLALLQQVLCGDFSAMPMLQTDWSPCMPSASNEWEGVMWLDADMVQTLGQTLLCLKQCTTGDLSGAFSRGQAACDEAKAQILRLDASTKVQQLPLSHVHHVKLALWVACQFIASAQLAHLSILRLQLGDAVQHLRDVKMVGLQHRVVLRHAAAHTLMLVGHLASLTLRSVCARRYFQQAATKAEHATIQLCAQLQQLLLCLGDIAIDWQMVEELKQTIIANPSIVFCRELVCLLAIAQGLQHIRQGKTQEALAHLGVAFAAAETDIRSPQLQCWVMLLIAHAQHLAGQVDNQSLSRCVQLCQTFQNPLCLAHSLQLQCNMQDVLGTDIPLKVNAIVEDYMAQVKLVSEEELENLAAGLLETPA